MDASEFEHARQRARLAVGEELNALLLHQATPVLLELVQNPALDEPAVMRLLQRNDLPGEVLEGIAQRKSLLKSYALKKQLLFHPRVPRLAALRLLKDLYLMDLVQFSLLPSTPQELKRRAEEQILARLPQLPLGQKITLARRGSAHVAGALIAEGHAKVLQVALDNPFLTEAQLLKALSREKLPSGVPQRIAQHPKWSHIYNIRLALVRNPYTPLATILSFLPHLTLNDLKELTSPGIVAENLRKYLQVETQKRLSRREPAAK